MDLLTMFKLTKQSLLSQLLTTFGLVVWHLTSDKTKRRGKVTSLSISDHYSKTCLKEEESLISWSFYSGFDIGQSKITSWLNMSIHEKGSRQIYFYARPKILELIWWIGQSRDILLGSLHLISRLAAWPKVSVHMIM